MCVYIIMVCVLLSYSLFSFTAQSLIMGVLVAVGAMGRFTGPLWSKFISTQVWQNERLVLFML